MEYAQMAVKRYSMCTCSLSYSMCAVPALDPATGVQEIATYAHARQIASYAYPDNANEEVDPASVRACTSNTPSTHP